jgi:hypothetical protein
MKDDEIIKLKIDLELEIGVKIEFEEKLEMAEDDIKVKYADIESLKSNFNQVSAKLEQLTKERSVQVAKGPCHNGSLSGLHGQFSPSQ